MSDELANRFSWMSLISAVFVVIIHATSQLGLNQGLFFRLVSEGVCRAAVPFYFFASGYFLFTKAGRYDWWRKALSCRFMTVVIPYFFWCTAYYCFGLCICYVAQTSQGHHLDFSGWFTLDMIARTYGLIFDDYPLLQPYWYMRTLFLFVFISPCLYYVYKRCGVIGLIVICGANSFLCALLNSSYRAYFRFSFEPYYFLCFILGGGDQHVS